MNGPVRLADRGWRPHEPYSVRSTTGTDLTTDADRLVAPPDCRPNYGREGADRF